MEKENITLITLNRYVFYEDSLFKFIDKLHIYLRKALDIIDRIILTIITSWEYILFLLIEFMVYTQKFMRYTTFPIHWIWIKIHLRRTEKEKLTDLPLFQMGAHYVYGKPASGKSTLLYHAMMDYAYYTGKTSLTTHNMELARKNIYGREYYYHQLFDPSELFKDGKQIVRVNTMRFNMIVYEELLSKYHQRNNASYSHNSEVLPLVASMGGQRHQGLDLFFFISQLPTNDISIMQMLRGYHEPKIKKGFNYKHWLETGQFKLEIKGWWITSYNIEPVGREDYKKTNKYKWFYKFKYPEDFIYFNRYNLKETYDKLPIHKGAVMT